MAHLCAIYERIGTIPSKPKTVYRKIVSLLLDEWDEQRSVKRASKYSEFETDRKFEFLSHIAYYLTTHIKSTIFEKEHFEETYKNIYKDFGLNVNQCELVANELESHTGLFIQNGYKKYEFSHKSLQEYLTAEYIVRLPSIPVKKDCLETLSNEFAVAIAISSNPSRYFTELVLNRFGNIELSYDYFATFITRLILEKPDFKICDDINMAMCTLLTLCLSEGYISARRVESNKMNEEALNLFLHFQNSLMSELVSSSTLHYYFTPDSGTFKIGSHVLRRFQRKKNHDIYNIPTTVLSLE